MRAIIGASLIVFTSCGTFGQPPAAPPAFEVASVKPSNFGRAGDKEGFRENIATSPGSLTMRNVTLRSGVQWAYGVKDYQLSGPAWLGSERYDIIARAAAPAPDNQLRLMLRTLLADRFHLALHRENKELPVYALVVARNGPKLRAAAGGGAGAMGVADGALVFRNYSMAEFAARLSGRPFGVDRPVLDSTGLTGHFDFTLKLAGSNAELKGKAERGDERLSMFTIVREELGLRLEPRKAPVEILVIDQAEKVPTEN